MKCHLHGFKQRQVLLHHDVLHKLHKHLRICVALELYAIGHQLILDIGIVLYDAIMYDCQITGA